MKSGFFLDVIIRQSMTILKLFTSENKTLLVRWNTLFILNLLFYIFDVIGTMKVKSAM